jgi:glucosylceramidase
MARLLSTHRFGLVLAVVVCGCGSNPNTPGDTGAGVTGAGATGATGAVGSGGTPGAAASGGAGAVGTGGGGGLSTGGTGSGGAPSGGAGGSVGGTGGSAGSAGGGGAPPVNLPPLVTSAPGAYWQTDGALTESTESANVTVEDTATAQTWEGFGTSFNELGWSFLTSTQMQNQAVTLLFSASDGANFTWGRIPMGSSDYGVSRYTLADTGTDVVPESDESNRPPEDTSLTTFSLERDGQMLIPFVKAAQVVKPDLRFWASPWTPPAWMKTGYKTNSGADGSQPANRPSYFDGGNMRDDSTILTAYAEYFTRFVEGYRVQGIDIEVVSPQNEPGYDQNYPSCLWDSATYTTFIGQYLGPAMDSLGIGLMLGTMSNAGDGGRNDVNIANAVLADATASGFLSVGGVQWGVLDEVNDGTRFGELPIWATEHKAGNYPWNPAGSPAYNDSQAPNDQAYAVESWGYIRNAILDGRVTSYSSWNAVLDSSGLGIDTTRDWKQNALLVAEGGTVTATPTYHVFRHFSQYVAPGATVVGTTGGDAVAFNNPDGSLVVVMFNSGAANANYVVSIGGQNLQFSMPENGWATVKYTPQ